MALNLDTLGLAATVSASGITAPDYQTILTQITGYFQQIYGSDAYLEPDSKDGQMVALVALAIHDANNSAMAVYNSFSPSTAMGNGLSSNVKINGITRKTAISSTVDMLITGTPGLTITNGSVKDANNVVWNLPASVAIGVNGTVTVSATCATAGAIAASANTVTQINTPTLGWLSATNPTAASTGSAAETDIALRTRQTISTSLTSATPFEAVNGALANITGVSRLKLFENDTGGIDDNGLPAHSISAVVEGGDAAVIAEVIRGKKGQGVSTHGTTEVIVADEYGNPHTIGFSRPVDVPVYIAITLNVFTGYTSIIGDQIKEAIAAYINSLDIGSDVLLSRVYSPANLGVVSGGNSKYYDIIALELGRDLATVTAGNIDIAWNESASSIVDNIIITVPA